MPAKAVHLEPHQLEELARTSPPRCVSGQERYLTKQELAAHLGCGTRSVEGAMKRGMPHSIIFGKAKFRLTDVEMWLESSGDLEPRGLERPRRMPGRERAGRRARPRP